ncbi:FmdB family zinc ribbon protein [Burkholderia sp. PAMC 26561]|uniref:FmdB family zinc ribbon protein n=1 Tax=Burkholderia sp. PAMC 26561 TaxID=1795043 RepID=UPI003FA44440
MDPPPLAPEPLSPNGLPLFFSRSVWVMMRSCPFAVVNTDSKSHSTTRRRLSSLPRIHRKRYPKHLKQMSRVNRRLTLNTMPVYDYECPECGQFETARRIAERNDATACPQCGMTAQRVMVGAPSLSGETPEPGGGYGMRHMGGCACCR